MKTKFIGLLLTLSVSILFIPTAEAVNSQGSGSSFAANFIEKCRVAYASTGNSISYVPNGSGAGKNQLALGITDFAISDVPYGASEAKPKKDFIYVPIVAGPIAISYRLDGYKGTLKLTKDNLSKIFSRQITMWNDPLIQKDNPIKLPSKKISVLYRSDGSGTSEIFTTYLNKIAGDIWTKPGNKSFLTAFPGNPNDHLGYMISAAGAQGIQMLQSRTDGSIAYNELSYASFKVAYLENGAKMFIKPSVSAASRFLSEFVINSDGTITPNYNNPDRLSYNLSTFSYGITTVGSKDVAKFFTFAITKCQASELGYSPITGSALKLAKAQISKI